ncbi:MAG: hypothetical protein R2867_38485 [Caldilineaceae bacterium]
MAGNEYSCAVTTAGGASCWGNNTDGQLGDGTDRPYRSIVDVVGLQSGVKALAAGARHTCAIVTDSSLRCWGANDHKQVDGSIRERWIEPVAITAITEPVQMAALGGDHSCALLESGGVRCWGRNDLGQLGAGDSAAMVHPWLLAAWPVP